ncbi:MAG: 50S ribosomal protein L13 [Candidatus Pacebacteria bacterium]|nr:50S ribosomal protein L13 [Candidatus Paceibacterota bacterium]
MTEEKTYTIDAGGQTLGRVASAAAKALMGKTRADYTPHIDSKVKVSIVNASKIYTREKKRTQKTYTTYSGYPGGLRIESMAQLVARKGGNAEAIRRAVSRMLPRNTMKTSRLKNLTITE